LFCREPGRSPASSGRLHAAAPQLRLTGAAARYIESADGCATALLSEARKPESIFDFVQGITAAGLAFELKPGAVRTIVPIPGIDRKISGSAWVFGATPIAGGRSATAEHKRSRSQASSAPRRAVDAPGSVRNAAT
jgi:hypothetical protein